MRPTVVCAVSRKAPQAVVAVSGELAAHLDARLVLVHVQGDPTLLPGSVPDRERARHRLNDVGLALLHDARARLPVELDVECRSELGPVVPTLCSVAEETDAILLVAGCRRRGLLLTSPRGSVSHRLARRLPCPMLIVPDPPEAASANRGAAFAFADTLPSLEV